MPKLMKDSFVVMPQGPVSSNPMIPAISRAVSMSPSTTQGAAKQRAAAVWRPRPMAPQPRMIRQPAEVMHAPISPNATTISDNSKSAARSPSKQVFKRSPTSQKNTSKSRQHLKSAFEPPACTHVPSKFEVRCKRLEIELKRHEMERKCLIWRVHRLENTVKSLKEHNEEVKAKKDIEISPATPVRSNTTSKKRKATKQTPQVKQEPIVQPRPHPLAQLHPHQFPHHLYAPHLFPPHLHHMMPHPHHFAPMYQYAPPPQKPQDEIPYSIRFYSCYNIDNCLPAEEDLTDDEDDDDFEPELADLKQEAAEAIACLSDPPALKRRKLA